MASGAPRTIKVRGGRTLTASPVFDTYWRFAAERQQVFSKRIAGGPPPWTSDPIIAAHRFTNVYRASDRVSQYLISNVIYGGLQAVEEVFFRTILFKIFNRIDTWELLLRKFGDISWKRFDIDAYAAAMDAAMASGTRLYSAAYIMPSPPFGNPRKHRNHLELITRMMKEQLPKRVASAKSLRSLFDLLVAQPSLGDFLAFQFAIDLNYSEIVDFSEMEFVVAGPGARDGISKCFIDTGGLSEAEVIRIVTEMADDEFARLGLPFEKLGGKRPLQLIDCQNVFCEISKYARVAHPDCPGISGRTRIKQKYTPDLSPLPQGYPPKWGIPVGPTPEGPLRSSCEAAQQMFAFATART